MAAHNGLQARILHTLSTRGALQRRAILQAVGGTSLDSVSFTLTAMKNLGLVERANNQCWRVTAVGRAEAQSLPPVEPTVETPAPVPAAAARYEPGPCDQPGITAEDLDCEMDGVRCHVRSATPPRPQDRLTDAPATDPAVTAVLERFARAAQDALDEYVYSVGDRRILDRLMAARDAAREAAEAAQGAAS